MFGYTQRRSQQYCLFDELLQIVRYKIDTRCYITMKFQSFALSLVALAASSDAFAPQHAGRTHVAVQSMAGLDLPSIEAQVRPLAAYISLSTGIRLFLTFYSS